MRYVLFVISRQDQKSVPVSEMVAALKIPRPFLRKLLQTLSTEGILDSLKARQVVSPLLKPPEI